MIGIACVCDYIEEMGNLFSTMKIMKFGGSSVRDAAQISQTIAIITDAYAKAAELIVVSSALEGTTNALVALGEAAASHNKNYPDELNTLKERHLNTAKELNATDSLEYIEEAFEELSDTLHGISLVGELSPRTLDLIMSFGERLSVAIIAEAIKPLIPNVYAKDARELITTSNAHGTALVDFETTNRAITTFVKESEGLVPIITGFIAATSKGATTTLGRGGSDLTAAIIGAAVNAEVVEIWTDVDGVMTADPRKVQQAFPIPAMSYDEMMELSHFGAKVIHPPTLIPALQKKIPIKIKNSFNPQAVGTLITDKKANDEAPIRGISSIDNSALLRLEGSGMVGVCGVATRLFNALAKENINVIIITQGSSEHSISFAVAPHQSDMAKDAIEEEFSLEINAHLVDRVVVEKELSIIAIVGENMCRTTGISGRLFGALGKNGVNVIAIAQGSSELNITCVIDRADETKALNVIHDAFFLSDTATLNLFVVGTGLIGAALLEQVRQEQQKLHDNYNLKLRLVGIANSKVMSFNKKGIPLSSWQQALKEESRPMEEGTFIEEMAGYNLASSVFVDCTASDTLAANYEAILNHNIAIVTPNKKANSGPYSRYQALKATVKAKGVKFLYEANVGAALPILSTITDLIRSGDTIEKIEGVLSGTLSYLFNNFSGDISFTEVVKKAQQQGYTEPDPRDDLNGMDVARKLLILARECGHRLELDEIAMEPLLTKESFACNTLDEFYSTLHEGAASLTEKKEKAEAAGKKLRYIATLEGKKASIALTAVDASHPFYSLTGSDNIIAITTARYHTSPLIIKGAGAGALVTAGEVFAGIIKVGGR